MVHLGRICGGLLDFRIQRHCKLDIIVLIHTNRERYDRKQGFVSAALVNVFLTDKFGFGKVGYLALSVLTRYLNISPLGHGHGLANYLR